MAHPSFLFLSLQPLNLEHYEAIRNMASEIQAYAPDARIMTTYYCGEYFPFNLRNLIFDLHVCISEHDVKLAGKMKFLFEQTGIDSILGCL